MSAPVHSLFITLKRSFAGTQEHHVRILQSLGFSYRQQTVEKPNVPHIRGAIEKVRGLLGTEGLAACSLVRWVRVGWPCDQAAATMLLSRRHWNPQSAACCLLRSAFTALL